MCLLYIFIKFHYLHIRGTNAIFEIKYLLTNINLEVKRIVMKSLTVIWHLFVTIVESSLLSLTAKTYYEEYKIRIIYSNQ